MEMAAAAAAGPPTLTVDMVAAVQVIHVAALVEVLVLEAVKMAPITLVAVVVLALQVVLKEEAEERES
jgi:hypothetical protein